MPVAVAYYGRLEAYFRDVPDLLSIPARRFCNLIVLWMMEHTDAEVWEKEYKDTFFGDPKVQQARQVSQAKLAPAEKGKPGSINIKKPEKPAEIVTDISQFLGRAGATGKPDPNKAALAEKAKSRAAITIGPDADGNLSVDTP